VLAGGASAGGPLEERLNAECAVMWGPGNSESEALVEYRVEEDRDCTRTVGQEADGRQAMHTASEGRRPGPEYRCAGAGRDVLGF